MSPFEGRVIQLSTSQTHTIALTNLGYVYTFGSNDMFELGLGHQEPMYSATRIPQSYFNNLPVIQVYASDGMSYALANDSSVFYWGTFYARDTIQHRVPKYFTSNVTNMNAGREHVVFITKEGHLKLFGYNSKGQVRIVVACYSSSWELVHLVQGMKL